MNKQPKFWISGVLGTLGCASSLQAQTFWSDATCGAGSYAWTTRCWNASGPSATAVTTAPTSGNVDLYNVGSSDVSISFDAVGPVSLDILSIDATGTGTMTLSQSAGTLSAGQEVVGSTGSGSMTQAGGNNMVNGNLLIATGAGSIGVYSLSAGSLSSAAEVIGAGGTGTFSQSGAGSSNAITGNLTIGAGSTYSLSAGTLAVGGTLTNNGTLYATSAFRASSLTNNGVLQLTDLVLNGAGSLANGGALTQTGALTLSNTGVNSNSGNWYVGGNQLQLAGASLINTGTWNLDSGLVTGAGILANAEGGVITGPGVILTTFANAGVIALTSGTISVANAFANTGQIQLNSIDAALNGGTIANSGLIAGSGNVNSAVNNAGTIQAVNGTLSFTGPLTNGTSGLISATSGSKVLVSSGLAANAGAIQLSGGTFDNGGFALINTGTISGYGTLNAGGVTNSGQIDISSGTSTINGNVAALNGSQTIVSGGGNATFYGTVDVKSGATLRVSSGSVATFFGTVDEATGSLFSGAGTINYEGRLVVGDAPGFGTDAGNVTLGAQDTYVEEIGGLAAGSPTGYSQYEVAGHLSFGGKLQIDWYDGFTGAAGESFQLFNLASGGGSSGQFSLIDFSGAPLAPGLSWDTAQLYTNGTISIEDAPVPLPPAWEMMAGGLGLLGLAALRRGPALATA